MRCPKLSYLVSTYNAGSYLNRHLHDLLIRQRDPNFEVVIVNPNSPDTDDAVAKKWAARDDRVNYIFHHEREPYGASWLRAWEAAKGDFVCNSNTDDLHHPDFTHVFYEAMYADRLKPETSRCFAYAGITVINEAGQTITGGIKPPYDFEVFSRECWGGPQVAWENSGFFRDTVDWDFMRTRADEYRSAYDYWLWLYFMSLGFRGHSIQQHLTIYTQRPDSIENSNTSRNNWETYSAISEFFPHHFWEGGKLHEEASEFADFNNRPGMDEWIARRKVGEKWQA